MQTELTYGRVRDALDSLSMPAALACLDNVLEMARLDDSSVLDVMDRLLHVELKARHDRRFETNMKLAGLPYRLQLEDFDFDAQPSIDSQLIGRLATLHFLEEGTNILLLGPPGVGKTALAVGLSLKAIESGHRVFFIACHDLVGRLKKAERFDRVDRLLSTMLRPTLLVLDEVGYTPLDRAEATFLFEVVAKRYDRRKPMIVTSNKSWGAWGEILPDQAMTAAILDRLLHRSVTINIQGESFRLREHRKAGLIPSPTNPQKGGSDSPSNVSNPNR
jgi:DNA replication protein DnaC